MKTFGGKTTASGMVMDLFKHYTLNWILDVKFSLCWYKTVNPAYAYSPNATRKCSPAEIGGRPEMQAVRGRKVPVLFRLHFTKHKNWIIIEFVFLPLLIYFGRRQR